MPSPAVDTKASTDVSSSLTVKQSWVPGEKTTPMAPLPVLATHLKHPAIVSNHRPPGGSWPMKPWSKDWLRGMTTATGCAYSVIEGRYTTDIKYNGTPLLHFPRASATNYEQFRNGFVRLLGNWSPSLQVGADNQARTNVLNEVSQKKWDIGVTALELKQTAGLVTDLAVGMTRTIEKIITSRKRTRDAVNRFFSRVIKHGDFYKAAAEVGITDLNLLNDIKDTWMQYQFGIKPTLYDIDNATTYLSQLVVRDQIPVTVRAKAGGFRDTVKTVTGTLTPIGDIAVHSRVKETCGVHYSVVYEIPTGQVRDITSLGLDNPYQIAWEVTQLSWMFDYAVGIGDWLQSFTAANGLLFKEGCKSVLRKAASESFQWQPKVSPSRQLVMHSPPALEQGNYAEMGAFSRELLTHGVVPAFAPSIKNSLGLAQLANSLFALSNVASGKTGYR